ncbi:hypothetical protein LNGFDJGK_01910 [Enterobacter hormaechei]|nr:hypothetical protein LNGFDJGK_01910 [Enterobacter hormaechei]VAC87764.1 Uncharacterised protein [Enterobacter hormaechei]
MLRTMLSIFLCVRLLKLKRRRLKLFVKPVKIVGHLWEIILWLMLHARMLLLNVVVMWQIHHYPRLAFNIAMQ